MEDPYHEQISDRETYDREKNDHGGGGDDIQGADLAVPETEYLDHGYRVLVALDDYLGKQINERCREDYHRVFEDLDKTAD